MVPGPGCRFAGVPEEVFGVDHIDDRELLEAETSDGKGLTGHLIQDVGGVGAISLYEYVKGVT